jgi:hypothetical protein
LTGLVNGQGTLRIRDTRTLRPTQTSYGVLLSVPPSTTTARPLTGQAATAAIAPTTRFCAPRLNNYGVADSIQIGGSVRGRRQLVGHAL